jgi:transposase-like protein
MSDWGITEQELEAIIARDDLLMRNSPLCPDCMSGQVQIKDKRTPAEWRCRECKRRFTFEPATPAPSPNDGDEK